MALIDINSIVWPITNEIRNKVNEAVNSISNKINGIIYNITSVISGAISPITNAVFAMGNNIVNGVTSAINGVRNLIEDKIRGVINGVGAFINDVKNTVNSAKDNLTNNINNIKNSIESKVTEIRNSIGVKIDAVVNSAKSEIKGFIDAVKSDIRNVVNDIKELPSKIYNKVENEANRIIDRVKNSVNDFIENAKNSINYAVNQVRNFISDKIEDAKKGLTILVDRVKSGVEDVRNYISNKLENAWSDIKNTVNNTYDKIKSGIETKIEELKKKAENTYGEIKEFITTKVREFRDRIDKIVEDIKDFISGKLDAIRDSIKEGVDNERKGLDQQFKKLMAIFDRVTNNQYRTYDDFRNDFEAMGGEGGILTLLFSVVTAVGALAHIGISVGQPYADNIVHLAQADAQNALLSPPTLIDLMYRGKIDTDEYLADFRKQGFSEHRSALMLESSAANMSPGDIQIAFLRGEITEETHDRMLGELHFKKENIALFKQLYMIIPPISDLITMSVREVFSTETAERFGQFEDFPEEFAGFAEQQGLSRDWARRYWAMHWSLPSPTMGFEMLHRDIIEEPDLKLLLKALDIMPFWREKLIQLSYSPYTRVDIRRMHAEGVLDENGVFKAYKEIGYNDEKARKLTEFTIKLNSKALTQGDKELQLVTKGVIQQAYIRGLIDKNNALNRLLAMGANSDEALFIISIWDNIKQIESTPDLRGSIQDKTIKMLFEAYAQHVNGKEETIIGLERFGITRLEAALELDFIDYQYETKLKGLFLDGVKESYINWSIDETTFRVILNDSGFSQLEIDSNLREFSILREQRLRKPPMGDIKRWAVRGFLDIEGYVNELKGQGFNDYYIGLYVRELEE